MTIENCKKCFLPFLVMGRKRFVCVRLSVCWALSSQLLLKLWYTTLMLFYAFNIYLCVSSPFLVSRSSSLVTLYLYICPLGNIQRDICILLLNAGHYNGNFPLFGLLCNFLAPFPFFPLLTSLLPLFPILPHSTSHIYVASTFLPSECVCMK